jgi:hypothetical protein
MSIHSSDVSILWCETGNLSNFDDSFQCGGLPPGTVVSLVAHKREVAGSIPAGSSTCWLSMTIKSRATKIRIKKIRCGK